MKRPEQRALGVCDDDICCINDFLLAKGFVFLRSLLLLTDLKEENKSTLLVEKLVQLERFPGKGGWTYLRIPEISPERKNPFGWKKVNGFIDHYEIKEFHLMPMGNGQLFMPVKAEIRKKINKQQGDWVKLILYADFTQSEPEKELLLCLEDEPGALENFKGFPETEQKRYIDWISSAKSEESKIERLARSIDLILRKRILKL